MKLCLTSTGPDPDSKLDARFGRCAYFLIFDSETGKVLEKFENPASEAAHGAGIQAAQTVMGKKPDAVITGNIGPNASSVLANAGIKVYPFAGFEGSLKDTLIAFKESPPEAADGPTVEGHFGQPE